MAPDGFVATRTGLSPDDALARLEALIAAKGLTVFARIDHAAGALSVELPLEPTTVLIFGNAKAGTKLMQLDQRIGIDLPLKLLIWADQDGTYLGYLDPVWLIRRYGLGPEAEPVAAAMAALLKGLVEEAADA